MDLTAAAIIDVDKIALAFSATLADLHRCSGRITAEWTVLILVVLLSVQDRRRSRLNTRLNLSLFELQALEYR